MGWGVFQAAGIGVSLSLLAAGTVHAAEAVEPNVVPSELNGTADWASAEPAITPTADLIPEVAPPAGGWTWAITPRVWTLWENDSYFQPLTDDDGFSLGFQQSNEAVFIPFAGGSISVTPGLGAPTFSLTALYGEGSADVHGVQGGFFGPGSGYFADIDVRRLDIEGIVQFPAAEGFSWLLGGRYINFRRDEDGEFFNLVSGDPIGFGEFHLEQDFYLAEAGLSLNRPVTAAGSLVAFGNLTGMVGYADVASTSGDFGVFFMPTDALEGGVFGVDTNAGLGYRLSPRIFASARYRLFYLTAPDFEFNDGGTFMHGPELNVTFTFGG